MTQSKKSKTGSQKARNSAARLLAVQTVYQMHKNDQDVESAIKEFLQHRSGIDADGDEMVSPDQDHYALVVRGVAEHQAQLNEMIILNRGEKGSNTQKTEPLLQSIFLCAGFELMVLQAIDAPVIISDYLHVTHAFYEGGEAKLVNALLDSMRKSIRG